MRRSNQAGTSRAKKKKATHLSRNGQGPRYSGAPSDLMLWVRAKLIHQIVCCCCGGKGVSGAAHPGNDFARMGWRKRPPPGPYDTGIRCPECVSQWK